MNLLKIDTGAAEILLKEMLARNDVEAFLFSVRHLVYQMEISPPLRGNALFLPGLDGICRNLAERTAILPPKPPTQLIVHVATEVYETGGHTRTIEDMVKALPEYQHVLVLTDAIDNYRGGRLSLEPLKPRFKELGLNVRLLEEEKLAARARELAALIHDFAPRAATLSGHLFDPVINAAISGRSAPRVGFIHHGDALPCLGATRTDYVHLDNTPACHEACKGSGNAPVFLGLTVQDHGMVDPARRKKNVAVTCGSPDKYAGEREFSYAGIVAALLAEGMEEIIHLGAMPLAQMKQIQDNIRALGSDPEGLRFQGNVPSLAAALQEIAPAFFMSSYPLGAGKAMIEAISVGLPILLPRAPSTPPLVCGDFTFGHAVLLSSLSGVPAALKKLQDEGIPLGRQSRDAYERHYTTEMFRAHLVSALALA